MSMMGKDPVAQKAAVDEYFKHWDNKDAGTETQETREARKAEYATLTRQYVLDLFFSRPEDSIMLTPFLVITTWQRTSTSMDGVPLSISVGLHMASLSTRQ